MEKSLSVLIVEDSEDDTLLLVRHLERAGLVLSYERVESGAELEAALERQAWDLVVADHTMPGFSGTAALRIVRTHDRDLPFLFVSGTIGEDVAVAAMRAGANDYVMKDNLGRLVPAIERALADAELQRQHRRAEAALRQAQRMEAVGRLAGGIAHDFNNLLTAILGFGEILGTRLAAAGIEPSELMEIRKAAEAAAGLARQLLTFSRRQAVQPRLLDLSELVGHIEQLLRRLIGEDVELVCTLAPSGLLMVLADHSQLEQVVLNLALNAREAMPRGGQLRVETALALLEPSGAAGLPGARPGRWARLLVSDTGVGMDEPTRGQIFEPFFTTKGERGGTGLGLSTVYGIVAQSGGFIQVESAPARGSVFEVYLPISAPGVELPLPFAVPQSLPRGSETVLLVEDSPGVRATVRWFLEAYGYQVLEARDGLEAVALGAAHPGNIDLLLSDVVMPGLGGVDLARRLAEHRPQLRVLLMSGYIGDISSGRTATDVELAFLDKPFTQESLIRKVREVLDGHPC